MAPERLYVVVRADLCPAQQAVQGLHAALEFARLHPVITRGWQDRSNTVALLTVPKEEALRTLCIRAQMAGLAYAPFQEPDLDDALTAVALEPSGSGLCRKLSLALGGR